MYTKEIKKMYKFIMENSKEYLKNNISQNLTEDIDIYSDFCKLADYKLEEILPEVYDLPKSVFKEKYYLVICFMAFDYALTKMQVTNDRKNQIMCGMLDTALKKVSARKRLAIGKQLNSQGKKNKYKAIVKKIDEGKVGKDDYIISYKEESNAFKVRVFECGALKLARKLGLGAEDVFPCVCRLDYIIAKNLGYNLTRTGTLADSYECCDFRFEYPGETDFDLNDLDKKK